MNGTKKNTSYRAKQIDESIDHFSGAVVSDKSALQRNRHIIEIKTHGRREWQKAREYGRRTYSELGVQCYQRTFVDRMHARDFPRQQQKAMIASGALNKMTSLGMAQSHRSA